MVWTAFRATLARRLVIPDGLWRCLNRQRTGYAHVLDDVKRAGSVLRFALVKWCRPKTFHAPRLRALVPLGQHRQKDRYFVDKTHNGQGQRTILVSIVIRCLPLSSHEYG